MVLYSIGKRIKNFLKVTVQYDSKKSIEKVINGDEYLKDKSAMKDGKVRWFYENGILKSECTYKNSMLDGISTHFYKSGKVKAKETYKSNKLNGLSIHYYEDGKTMTEESYQNGVLISRVSFDSEGRKTVEKGS